LIRLMLFDDDVEKMHLLLTVVAEGAK
jgi:hypothetical protein